VTARIETIPPVDPAALVDQLAAPLRPRLAEARSAVERTVSGEQAWQRLFEQGLVPTELYRSSERRFAVANTERSTVAAGGDRLDLRSAPATVDAALALGSDAVAALETERLARLLRTRLVPWGAGAIRKIDWVILTHQIPFSFRQGQAFNCALYSLELALEERGIDMRAAHPDRPELPQFVNDVIRMNDGWAKALEHQLRVPGEYGPPRKVLGTRFDTLENPFEVALKLWGWGYVLDHSCDQELTTARLYTCVVDAPQNLLHRLRGQSKLADRER
jgi:hypothetical protein